MKMNLHCFANLIPIMILALFSNSGLINATEVGKRTDALEASAWNESKWISAVDAPVVKGHNNGRAADGASWFVSTVKNEQKVISAKWMTAGLGVYELYVNGKPVGGEFLKPGFTTMPRPNVLSPMILQTSSVPSQTPRTCSPYR